MNKKAVVEKILKAGSMQGRDILSSTSGPSWAARPNAMQPQLNQAIEAWFRSDNSEPLKEIVATLHVMGALSDDEANDLMDKLDTKE